MLHIKAAILHNNIPTPTAFHIREVMMRSISHKCSKSALIIIFPWYNPDWGFANIVYFTRIRANVFYDYTDLKSLRFQTHYQLRSYGTEIYFDTKWWNQQPLQFGIRYSRLIDHEIVGLQPNRWEFILPITLIN
jgi:hypothetical protein